MTDPIDDLATRIVRLERQNRRRSSQLEHSSLVDGSLREFDGSEQPTQVAQYGKQWDGTSAAVTLVSPPPPAPSTPTVTPAPGGLVVAWDGTFEGDEFIPTPMDWRQTDVVVGPVGMDVIRTPPLDGITSPRGGETFFALEQGEYAVALVARTLAGRASEPSPVVVASPLPLVDSAQFDQALEDLVAAEGRLDTVATDLDANEAELEAAKVRLAKAEQDAIKALADALTANNLAGSKTTSFRQASAPSTTGRTAGDLWVDSDDGLLYIWTGSWTVSPDQRVAAVVASNATKTTLFTQTSQPPTTGRTTGDGWVDTDDENKLYVWDGAWTLRRDALITAANNLAQQAKNAADSKITVYRQSSAPTGTFVVNDLWLDIDDGLLYYASSTSGGWTLHSDQRIGLVVASNALKTTVFAQTSAPSTTGRTVGDLWIDTDDGNKVYDWPTGGGWTARPLGAAAISATARQLGGTIVYRQSAAPVGTFVIGDLWLDSDDGLLYIATSTSGAWTLHSDQRIAAVVTSNAAKITVFAQTSQPPTTARTAGDMWIDTDDDNRPYVWDGAWTDRRDVTIAAANIASLNLLAGGYGELDGMVGTVFNQLATATVYDTVDKPAETRGVFGCAAGAGTGQTGSTTYAWNVEPGAEYLVEIWLKADKANSKMYIDMRDDAGVLVPHSAVPGLPYAGNVSRPVDNHILPTAWTKYYAVAKPGAAATRMRVSAIYFNHPSGTERAAVQKLAIRVRPRVADKNLASLDLDKLVVTGTTNLNTAAAQHIASKTASFQQVDAANITVTGTSNLNNAVAQRLSAKIAEFIQITAVNIQTDALAGRLLRGVDIIGGTFITGDGDAGDPHWEIGNSGYANTLQAFSNDPAEIEPAEIRADNNLGDLIIEGRRTSAGSHPTQLQVSEHAFNVYADGDINLAANDWAGGVGQDSGGTVIISAGQNNERVYLEGDGSVLGSDPYGVGVFSKRGLIVDTQGHVLLRANASPGGIGPEVRVSPTAIELEVPANGTTQTGYHTLRVDGDGVTVGGDPVRLSNDPYIRALLATDNSQSPASGAWTTITGWTTPAESSSGITRAGGTFTVQRAGSYMLTIGISFAANATGIRGVRPVIAGSGGQNALFASPGGTFQGYAALNQEVYLPANTLVQFQAYQNSGGALALRGDAGGLFSTCSIRRVGR